LPRPQDTDEQLRAKNENEHQIKKKITEYKDLLKRVGGTALIEAVERDFEDIRVVRLRRSRVLMEEAKPIFDLWQRLKRADNAKKLKDVEAEKATTERKRRIAKEVAAIWRPRPIFPPGTEPGSNEFYEALYRDSMENATMVCGSGADEQRSDVWVGLFEDSRETDERACQHAVNRWLEAEYYSHPDRLDAESLHTGIRKARQIQKTRDNFRQKFPTDDDGWFSTAHADVVLPSWLVKTLRLLPQ